MMSNVKVLDTEVYKRYCLIGFIDPETGATVSVEAVDGKFSLDDREWLRKRMRRYQTIGFNSKPFDLPIIYAAIKGYDTRTLKRIADKLIVDGMKSWEIEDEYNFTIPRDIDHIDLIEVAPGSASLKVYNGRMHGKRMQDLPYEPNHDLSDDEIEEVYEYWKNDLDATINLWRELKTQLDLRVAMTKEYGIDLRSKSDAQVAEAVIKHGVKKILGRDPPKPKFAAGQRYRYNIPSFIDYGDNKQLNELLDDIYESWFKLSPTGKILMPQALADAKIYLGNSVYRLGIGGLHSSEEGVSYESDDEYVLIDRDVASYYPRIIINLGLYPPHIGKAFLKVYAGIVDKRLEAKARVGELTEEIKLKEEALKSANRPSELMMEAIEELKTERAKYEIITESLKITINGSFGKLGSKWSILFAPNLMIQTTITGQLSLLMLIYRIEKAGISVVSGNTDGIVIRAPRNRLDELNAIIKQWEKDTGFDTEETRYKAIYSRDVNNYIAVKEDGKAKRKGAYAVPGLKEKKNPANEICADAVVAYIVEGKPISQTIKGCKDLRKFLTVRTVRGGAVKDGEYLGKAIRWYYSASTTSAIHYKTANSKGNHNKVPRSDGGKPCMTLPEDFPDDVDFSWYIREAREILKEIAYEPDLIGVFKRKKKVVEEADAA